MKLSLVLSVIALSIATNEASRFTGLEWNGKQSQIQSDAPQTGTYQSSLVKRAAKWPPIRIPFPRPFPRPSPGPSTTPAPNPTPNPAPVPPRRPFPFPRPFPRPIPGFKAKTKRYLKLIKENLM